MHRVASSIYSYCIAIYLLRPILVRFYETIFCPSTTDSLSRHHGACKNVVWLCRRTIWFYFGTCHQCFRICHIHSICVPRQSVSYHYYFMGFNYGLFPCLSGGSLYFRCGFRCIVRNNYRVFSIQTICIRNRKNLSNKRTRFYSYLFKPSSYTYILCYNRLYPIFLSL